MSNPNVNCLSGMRCPNKECGSYGPFHITLLVCMEVGDDGNGPECGDSEWDDGNTIYCPACDRKGVVSDFKDPEVQE